MVVSDGDKWWQTVCWWKLMMNETKIYQTTVQTGMAIISVSSCSGAAGSQLVLAKNSHDVGSVFCLSSQETWKNRNFEALNIRYKLILPSKKKR